MIPDYIVAAEEELLGGILQYGEADCYAARALEQLEPSDFGIDKHRQWFAALQGMRGKTDINPINFSAAIKTVPLEQVVNMAAKTVTTANFPSLMRILKDGAKGRRIKERLGKALQSENILAELETIVETEKSDQNHADYQQVMENSLNEFVDEICKPLDKESRIWTGFSRLDKSLGGLRKQSVSMVGARPSTGKTAFALNVMKNQLNKSCRMALFSLEMSATQILERMCAEQCGISYGKITDRCLSKEEQDKIKAGAGELMARKGFYILDDIYTIEGIGKAIADLKPDFAVIDFIQIVSTLKRFQTRRNEMDYISQQIKRLAKRHNCHIMTLSQLTRDGASEPKMTDLKESGALEQDNDYIMLLHRPYVIDKRGGYEPEEASVLLDKNKYGRTGIVDLCFVGDLQRFGEVARI